MTNRRDLSPVTFTLEKNVVTLIGYVTFVSGTPTLDAAKSKGIWKIVHDSTGLYTITLGTLGTAFRDIYPRLLFVDLILGDTSDGYAPGYNGEPLMTTIASNAVATTGAIQLALRDHGGTLRDPTDTGNQTTARILIKLSNSTADGSTI